MSPAIKYFFLASMVLLNLFEKSNGASCTSYLSETDCENDDVCVWLNTNGGYCGCASDASLDIMFIMDASGSVGSSNWVTEQDFVINMIETGVNDDSQIAIMDFASGAWAQWNFTDSQVRSDITTHVSNMGYTQGSTHMKTALTAAITVFDKTGDPNLNNVAMLITDGNPYPSYTQSVCDSATIKNSLDDAGITVVIIGVGTGWSTSSVSCLVDDEDTQIIYVDNFDDDAFNAVRDLTDAFTCPEVTNSPSFEPTLEPTGTAEPTEEPTLEPQPLP